MNKKKIVVVGGNFAGMTAALSLKNKLEDSVEVAVVSKMADFLFMPSMIWLPFGLRSRADITFPLQPVYEKRGVRFVHDEATRLDLVGHNVETRKGQKLAWDYLVIATGPKLNYEAIPGYLPKDNLVQSIFSLDDAERAKAAFEAFLQKPGPVVIGGTQGTGCFGAAYEFLFNFAHQLKKRGLADQAPLTYVTAEPSLAYFGIGGFGRGVKVVEKFFEKRHVTGIVNVAVKEFRRGEVELSDGRVLPHAFAMFAPSFLGVDAVRACTDIATPAGFVKVKSTYQTEKYPEVYAAGIAVQIDPPQKTDVPCGVPKTGYLAEEMGKVVAHNIAADIWGEPLLELPPGAIDAKCLLDAGNTGIILTADHLLEPRDHAWLIPGPEAHWAKLAFERYFLATHKHGVV